MNDDFRKLDANQMGGGIVGEIFAHSLEKVVENILDPNCKATKPREITLKIRFLPNEDRSQVVYEVQPQVKLVAKSPEVGMAFITMQNKRPVMVESTATQAPLFDAEEVPANRGQESEE